VGPFTYGHLRSCRLVRLARVKVSALQLRVLKLYSAFVWADFAGSSPRSSSDELLLIRRISPPSFGTKIPLPLGMAHGFAPQEVFPFVARKLFFSMLSSSACARRLLPSPLGSPHLSRLEGFCRRSFSPAPCVEVSLFLTLPLLANFPQLFLSTHSPRKEAFRVLCVGPIVVSSPGPRFKYLPSRSCRTWSRFLFLFSCIL